MEMGKFNNQEWVVRPFDQWVTMGVGREKINPMLMRVSRRF